jgi:flagellar protein FliO/FliZ
MTTDTLGLVLRLVLSLAAVVGLMWVAARVMRGQLTRGQGGALEVVARQQVGRGASIAVVRVADQALVLGVTENKVTLISAADLGAVQAAQATAEEERIAVRSPVDADGVRSRPGESGGRLQGSIVSPATWKQAVDVIRDRTARKG